MLKAPNGTFTIGSCNDVTKTIYIADDLEAQLMKKVLCHEVTNAAMFSYNVFLTYEQEELIADLLATYGEEIVDITNKIFSRIKYR